MNDLWEVEIQANDRFTDKCFKKPSAWMRIDVALIFGAKWRSLDDPTRALWLLILALGTSQGSLKIALGSTQDVSKMVRCKPHNVPNVVSRLVDFEWLRILRKPEKIPDAPTNGRTNGRTNIPVPVQKTEPPPKPRVQHPVANAPVVVRPPQRVPDFDFQEIYALYPLKEGKSRGLKMCEQQIRTQKDFDDLKRAVVRYRDRVAGTKYIKHFSTFMGSWRDCLDDDFGTMAEVDPHRQAAALFNGADDAI